MKQRRIAFLLLLFVVLVILSACSAEEEAAMRITLDRAVYLPGSQVACAVENPTSDMANLRFRLLHLKDTVLEETIDPGSTDITFALPEDDFTGYLLVAEGLDPDGQVVAAAMTGIDCSSSWTKFPRYGYLWDHQYGKKD